MIDLQQSLQQAKALREKLHTIPEASGCENQTKQTLMDFLKANSDLEVIDCGKWFYAAHRENAEEGMALRADMDAVTGVDGRPWHGCGHDGHMSVMAALAAGVAAGASQRGTNTPRAAPAATPAAMAASNAAFFMRMWRYRGACQASPAGTAPQEQDQGLAL